MNFVSASAPFRRGKCAGSRTEQGSERLPPPALSGSGSKGTSQPVLQRTPLSLIAVFIADKSLSVTPKKSMAVLPDVRSRYQHLRFESLMSEGGNNDVFMPLLYFGKRRS
ncbi:hypothetical protein RGR602_PC01062 (plasmid) [Rhizobium gallicum bv. gallicum R602sp]|uniref:Uncharacterized protein n=1 Tax=Rhizobium gallicum bv. gallicum R602sp TaxID=1041138 RepID=A0A0B4XEM2_9HYPH|nr:hypothetical protein RGR602_PC01062 [Rhizobium gallicum bv. gallicum R602sp]